MTIMTIFFRGLFVGSLVCQQDNTKTTEWISKKLRWWMHHCPESTKLQTTELNKFRDKNISALSFTSQGIMKGIEKRGAFS